MTILSIKADFVGEIGVYPRLVRLVSNDLFAVVTAENYLSLRNCGIQIYATDYIFAAYGADSTTLTLFLPTIDSSGNITLSAYPEVGNAINGAVIAGNVAAFYDTIGTLQDGGLASNKLLTSSITTPDVGSNIVSFDVTCGFSALATGGAVALITSSGSKQYKIRQLFINKTGTNFSGGGGDRLGQVTDGTSVYSVIPATNMQTLLNAGWGISTPLPYPASVSINTSTAAGANLSFKYSGGTTDYTAGSVVISGTAQRVA